MISFKETSDFTNDLDRFLASVLLKGFCVRLLKSGLLNLSVLYSDWLSVSHELLLSFF